MFDELARALATRGIPVFQIACTKEKVGKVRVERINTNQWEARVPSELLVSPASARKTMEDIAELVRDIGFAPSAIHFTHFSRITFEMSEVLSDVPCFVTLTDFSAFCADFQYYQFSRNRICTETSLEECKVCTGRDLKDLAYLRQSNLSFLNSKRVRVLCQTPHQRVLLERFGLSPEQVISDTASYPTSRKWVPEIRRRRKSTRYIFVGRCSDEKGLHKLVRSFSLAARKRPMRLNIFTTDGRMCDVMKGVRRRGINFHGVVSPGKLNECLRDHDVLLLPSLWLENHPIILEQALSQGLPVIAPDTPTLRHLKNRKGIYFARQGHVFSWSRAIGRLYGLAGRREAVAKRCPHGYDRFVEDLIACYDLSAHPLHTPEVMESFK